MTHVRLFMRHDQGVFSLDSGLHVVPTMPVQRPLVAIERASGSVRETCRSGEALSRPPLTCALFGGSVAKGMKKISYSGYRFPPEIIHHDLALFSIHSEFSTTLKICWQSAALRSLMRQIGVG
jgi:hypothetical protein